MAACLELGSARARRSSTRSGSRTGAAAPLSRTTRSTAPRRGSAAGSSRCSSDAAKIADDHAKLESSQDWQRDRIRASIARAWLALGQPARAQPVRRRRRRLGGRRRSPRGGRASPIPRPPISSSRRWTRSSPRATSIRSATASTPASRSSAPSSRTPTGARSREAKIRNGSKRIPVEVGVDLFAATSPRRASEHGDATKARGARRGGAQDPRRRRSGSPRTASALAARVAVAPARRRRADGARASTSTRCARGLRLRARAHRRHLPRRRAARARRGLRGDRRRAGRARRLPARDRGRRRQPQLPSAGRGPRRDVPVDGPRPASSPTGALVADPADPRWTGRPMVRRRARFALIACVAGLLARSACRSGGAGAGLDPRHGLRPGLRRAARGRRRSSIVETGQKATTARPGQLRLQPGAPGPLHARRSRRTATSGRCKADVVVAAGAADRRRRPARRRVHRDGGVRRRRTSSTSSAAAHRGGAAAAALREPGAAWTRSAPT